MAEAKRRRGRPAKKAGTTWDTQIFVRVNDVMKKAVEDYRDRNAFPSDSEAIRDIVRTRLQQEGLL